MNALTRLHRDEGGLQTLETVAILAIAAIVLAVLKSTWQDIKRWFRTSVSEVIDWQGEKP